MTFGVERWTAENGTSILKVLADPFVSDRGTGPCVPSTSRTSDNPSRWRGIHRDTDWRPLAVTRILPGGTDQK